MDKWSETQFSHRSHGALGQPSSQLSSTRIALYTVGSPTFLRTQSNTVATRYFVRLRLGQEEEQPEPCYNDNDLVIVVDCSGSIGQQNYYSALEFAAKLTTVWVDNPYNRIAVVVYSDRVQTVIGLR
ncbi:von Willebrand factor A domain-containing protein 2 [Orchesella cincta]|uniref:von Willebrand factor A domain-containing protein 2 n=1 Tax=Orchesella cincta TaxID=48709 RepID=A0A1D2MGY5_ORCCI|nr:von Willebrand factor A domain-containing protein 2 [Orchesella cincta]